MQEARGSKFAVRRGGRQIAAGPNPRSRTRPWLQVLGRGLNLLAHAKPWRNGSEVELRIFVKEMEVDLVDGVRAPAIDPQIRWNRYVIVCLRVQQSAWAIAPLAFAQETPRR